jgi:BASS family bile acid:Na+ symporter
MPLVLPLLLEGVSVDALKIAKSLLLLMLLPLAAGLVIRSRLSRVADRIRGPLNRISGVSLIVLIGLLLITNIKNVISLFGTRGLLASVLFLVCGVAIGWFLGGANVQTRGVLSLGTAQRNIAAAILVGGQNFDDPKVLVMVVVVAVIGLLTLMPLARLIGAHSAAQEAQTSL